MTEGFDDWSGHSIWDAEANEFSRVAKRVGFKGLFQICEVVHYFTDYLLFVKFKNAMGAKNWCRPLLVPTPHRQPSGLAQRCKANKIASGFNPMIRQAARLSHGRDEKPAAFTVARRS